MFNNFALGFIIILSLIVISRVIALIIATKATRKEQKELKERVLEDLKLQRHEIKWGRRNPLEEEE